MCKDILITGISVKEQMEKAKEILEKEVIPKEEQFQQREQDGTLSKKVQDAIAADA